MKRWRTTQKNLRVLQKKAKEVKFVPKVKLGRRELLILIQALMQTWPPPNIVKILIMRRNLKVKPNGSFERLGKAGLG